MGNTLLILSIASSLINGTPARRCQEAPIDSVPVQQSVGYQRPASLALPLVALAYGCLKPAVAGIGRLDEKVWNRFSTETASNGFSVETALQWTPTASVYVMDAAGIPLRHRFKEHLWIDAGSMVLAGGAGWVMRQISGGMPDFGLKPGTQFPSGHATNAFRGAEILRQELKGRSQVLSWSGYAMATLVSLLRLKHGQHQLSEVVSGAGLGILSVQSLYWLKSRIPQKALARKH